MGKHTTTEQQGQGAGAAPVDSKSSAWTGLLGSAGFVAIAAGGLLAIGSRHVPEIAWIAKSFSRMGIESGMLIGSGVISCGLAILTHQVHRVGLKMRAAEEAVRCTHSLGLGMRKLVDRMTSLHAELSDLTESHGAGLRLLQEQVKNQTGGMQVDATYRLAASMDQLGRQLDERLSAQEESSAAQFGSLDRSLSESRQQVRNLLEETRVHRIEDLLEIRPGSNVDLESEPVLEDEETEETGDLEVSVELEELPADDEFDFDAEDGPKIDVSAFNWDDIEIPERGHDDGLGLLDEFDEPETLPGPLPSSGTTKLEWEDPPMEARSEDLGLLDELGDDGMRTEPANEPEAALDKVPSIVSDTPTPTPIADLNEPDLFSKEDLEEAWKAFRDSERE